MNRKSFLLALDGAEGAGGEAPKSTDELARLRLENALLKTENEDLKKVTELEPAIREKMAVGLTRDQAESVIKQQADTDKEIARLEADQTRKPSRR
jgi:hypothetical protein